MYPGIRPVGGHLQFWRRQRKGGDGRTMFPAPIYVFDPQTGTASWYTESGAYFSKSAISVQQMLNQGGVALPHAPWSDPSQQLPEGF